MLIEILCLPFTMVCYYSPNITQNRKSTHPNIAYEYRELWICFHEHAAFGFDWIALRETNPVLPLE